MSAWQGSPSDFKHSIRQPAAAVGGVVSMAGSPPSDIKQSASNSSWCGGEMFSPCAGNDSGSAVANLHVAPTVCHTLPNEICCSLQAPNEAASGSAGQHTRVSTLKDVKQTNEKKALQLSCCCVQLSAECMPHPQAELSILASPDANMAAYTTYLSLWAAESDEGEESEEESQEESEEEEDWEDPLGGLGGGESDMQEEETGPYECQSLGQTDA